MVGSDRPTLGHAYTDSGRVPAMDTANWPIPDRTVTVNGRQLNAELAVVAGVHLLGALALVISVWSIFKAVPSMLGDLFSSWSFEFALAWIVLLIATILAWMIALMVLAAVAVYRGSPVGRALVTLFAVILLLVVLSADTVPGFLWVVLVVSVACAADLWLSPNVRRVYAAWSDAAPWEVTFALTVSIWYFSQIGFGAVVALPGLRFASVLDGQWVICLLAYIAAGVLGCMALVRLRRGPDRTARTMLVAAAGIFALGLLILQSGSNGDWTTLLQALALVGVLAWALYVPPASRAWFAAA